MNNKILAASVAIALVAIAGLFFILSPGPGQTGFFTLNFSCNSNGVCNYPSETYADCPQDCCSAQCTGCTNSGCTTTDSTCHSECNVGGTACSVFRSTCNGLAWGATTCYNNDTTVVCCSATPQDCTATQFCSAGSCSECSIACNGACQSSGCFGIDPDCNATGGATLACCGNGSCDGTETCVSCPADCPGAVVCDSNVGCPDDANSMTLPLCVNPGACNSSCSFCAIRCSSNSACNDNNSLTTDVCNNPGTCFSTCAYSGCAVACDSNSACNDSNSMTLDICSNPGTCSSSCSHSFCSIACSSNANCNDSNSLTTDICTNAGTCSASCTHSSCSVACDSNSACSDGVAETWDICSNPGTCSSSCSHSPCTVACTEDIDCDDGLETTNDYCFSGGTCYAECVYRECDVACSANSDCDDSDSGTADICSNPGTCEASCSSTACTIACSSDSQCNDNDVLTADTCSNAGTCESICRNEQSEQLLLVKLPPDFNASISRGQSILLSVTVTDNQGSPVSGAVASLADSEGNKVLFEDKGNGIYSAVYEVPAGIPLGEQDMLLVASKDEDIGSSTRNFLVQNGTVRAMIVSPVGELKAAPGEKVEFKFRLVYDSNAVAEDADANVVLNGVPIPLVKDSNGSFVGNYFFSEADSGTVVLLVNAWDSFGNTGLTEFAFEVASPFDWFWIILIILAVVAVALCIFGLKKTHKLSSLIGRISAVSLQKRIASLRHGSAKGREKDVIAKKIGGHEKELVRLKKEAVCERKKQSLSISTLPMESRYAVHKAAVSASLLPKKISSIFSPEAAAARSKAEKRIGEINEEIGKIKELIQNLEAEYCKQTIKEDFFRQKLFDYREKLHVLELEKKKIE